MTLSKVVAESVGLAAELDMRKKEKPKIMPGFYE